MVIKNVIKISSRFWFDDRVPGPDDKLMKTQQTDSQYSR